MKISLNWQLIIEALVSVNHKCFQAGAILLPKGQIATSGNTFGCYKLGTGTAGIKWVEARDAAKDFVMPRATSTTNNWTCAQVQPEQGWKTLLLIYLAVNVCNPYLFVLQGPGDKRPVWENFLPSSPKLLSPDLRCGWLSEIVNCLAITLQNPQMMKGMSWNKLCLPGSLSLGIPTLAALYNSSREISESILAWASPQSNLEWTWAWISLKPSQWL